MLKRVVSVVGALLLLAVLVPHAGASGIGQEAGGQILRWQNGEQCPDVIMIGARGSGQGADDDGGLGKQVGTIAARVQQQLNEHGISMAAIGLPYPAVPMEEYLKGSPNLFDSVERGETALVWLVNAVHDACGDSQITLAGYSQGAWAIKAGAARLSPAVRGNVAAMLLLGDPMFDPTGGGLILGNTSTRTGMAGATEVPGYLKGKTLNVCLTGDPVCLGEGIRNFAVNALSNGFAIHSKGYSEMMMSIVAASLHTSTIRGHGEPAAVGSEVATALIIDSSGSMVWNDPEDRRRDAARAYLTASAGSDLVGVVDFDSAATVLSDPLPVGSQRAQLQEAIRRIDSSGGTNLGAGLSAGCRSLSSVDASHKAALFFTDGDGPYSGEVQCYIDNGWPVYVFGLGNSVNEATLARIASSSGGSYKPLASATNLTCEFQQVRAQIAGMEPQTCAPTGHIKPGELLSTSVTVEPRTNQTTFTNAWLGSDIPITLVSPSGRRIDRTTMDSDVIADRGAAYETISVVWPEAGEWQVEFFGLDVPPEGEPFTFSTVALADANEAPVARFSVTVADDGSVLVDAGDSSDDDEQLMFIWTFGEEHAVIGPETTQHRFAAAGDHVIELTVLDSGLVPHTTAQLINVPVAPEDEPVNPDDAGDTGGGDAPADDAPDPRPDERGEPAAPPSRGEFVLDQQTVNPAAAADAPTAATPGPLALTGSGVRSLLIIAALLVAAGVVLSTAGRKAFR